MMKNEKKVFIKIGSEDEENVKSSRRILKDLQTTATDKKNLAGRPQILKDSKLISDGDKSETKRKKVKVQMQNKSVQTGECIITANDLISDEPSYDYWKRLAETREQALSKSLQENETLKDNITALQEENKICKEMLEEAKHLIKVLQEMLEEKDDEDEDKNNDETKEDEKRESDKDDEKTHSETQK